jgi:hypothetical protein
MTETLPLGTIGLVNSTSMSLITTSHWSECIFEVICELIKTHLSYFIF